MIDVLKLVNAQVVVAEDLANTIAEALGLLVGGHLEECGHAANMARSHMGQRQIW